ncbi:1-aminocyclopropane-1-carboxylate deaminase/D-cysteine desulfhydrase [Gillisia limnaea]|uniref:1-aminocyclopropane-1-carboxylate deaminase-like protein n=1 Tax=Gillisia limnaea (strain DSM 15749 / LMG 21470 / R-8282) TaxID=865937 RepID=H2BTT5_GILLR|nr:pyridoxal-phosphate dependent enzyme [Gillisia limnaea]EHQ03749.1 1-aminocyclopropane-1-carboxylate deaminase-like protein [Gillisia limnaea DSM 15749]
MSEPLNFNLKNSPNQLIRKFDISNCSLFLKREDLLHSEVSGNKFRKLKYNLQEAKNQKKRLLLTFGGAFSNHISAVAAAGKMMGFETIGIIRGEELGKDPENTFRENPTLRFAASQGMELRFVSRDEYREKDREHYIEKLKDQFGDFYLLPEGGTNAFAIQGCQEILSESDKNFDFICCPVGTGGTISGIINSSEISQKVLGFPALKGDFLRAEISGFTSKTNWELIEDYHFGGYAKISSELITFINEFHQKTNIALDPVYTGKMIFGIFDMIERSAFPENSRILAIHTGGLQGIAGMNMVLLKKNLPLIDVWNEI